jgi:uncharacterized protein
MKYEKRWAFDREEEKAGCEWLVDEIMRRKEENQRMHVYHFGAYEPGALKRLMGMYATREDQIDRLLRAGVLVDLHQAFKQGVRASVEEYSLKKVEAFYGFERRTPLEESRQAMRYVEHRLELGWKEEELPAGIRNTLEGYNSEDCISTAALRDWLEQERRKVEEGGMPVPRPADKSGDPSEKLQEKLDRAAAVTAQLSLNIPADPKVRLKEESAKWLLAQLLSWHRREDKRAGRKAIGSRTWTRKTAGRTGGIDSNALRQRVSLQDDWFQRTAIFRPASDQRESRQGSYFGDERFGEWCH